MDINNYDKSLPLIDVRMKEEFDEGHLPNAIHVPLNEIPKGLSYPKEQPILVYCRSGHRSEEAKLFLDHMGYENVINIGGILDYEGELVK